MQLTKHLMVGLLMGASVASTMSWAAKVGDSLGETPAQQNTMLSGLREAIAFKQSLTPAERKLGASLLVEQRQRLGQALPPGLADKAPRGQARRAAAQQGIYKIKATPSDTLYQAIEGLGGAVRLVADRRGVLTARLPDSVLLDLAQREDVISIRRVRTAIPQQVSPGQKAHKVDLLQPQRTGAGTVIGVISERVNPVFLKALVDGADLPPDAANQLYAIDWTAVNAADRESQSANWTVATTGAWADANSTSDDGLAMLQVLYDIAPDATLLFTSYNGDGVTGMEAAIDALANPPIGAEYPKATVIVDDLFFFDQVPFQDDVLAQAATAAVASGTAYVTSAGDFGNAANNTASTYEADFDPTTPVNTCAPTDTACNSDFDFFFGSNGYEVHDFGGVTTLEITENLSELCLFWAEPLGGADSDYDLFVFDTAGNLVDLGDNFVGDPLEPAECVGTDASLIAGNIVVVAATVAGSEPRFLHLSGLPLALEQSGTAPTSNAFSTVTSGAIRGQAGATEVLSVGAANAPDNAGIPRAFAATDPVAAYSSDGLRRVYFDADGTPITPGNLLATGGRPRVKPDIVAADGIPLTILDAQSQLVGGTFFGTSASAAHAAGLLALMQEAEQASVPGDLTAALRAGAVDLDPAGADIAAGFGAADVVTALTRVVDPARVRNLRLTPAGGSFAMTFTRPVDDLDSDFTFTAVCNQMPQGGSAAQIFSGPVDFASLPLVVSATPGAVAQCAVTAVDGANTSLVRNSGGIVPAAMEAPQSTALTVGSLTAGATLSFAASANDLGNLQYRASCFEAENEGATQGTSLVSELRVPGSAAVQATPGRFITCSVTPEVVVNQETIEGTPATTTSSVQANAIVGTQVTLTPDAGGFSVAFTVDPNIVDPSMLAVLLSCTAGGQPVAALTDVDLSAGNNPRFLEADPEQELSCSVVTTLSVYDTAVDAGLQPVVATVTPEEPISGLPIWLLYQATQPNNP